MPLFHIWAIWGATDDTSYIRSVKTERVRPFFMANGYKITIKKGQFPVIIFLMLENAHYYWFSNRGFVLTPTWRQVKFTHPQNVWHLIDRRLSMNKTPTAVQHYETVHWWGGLSILLWTMIVILSPVSEKKNNAEYRKLQSLQCVTKKS